MLKPYLFVNETAGKGRGVFTRERIPANTVVELAPVIVMDGKDRLHLGYTIIFLNGEKEKTNALWHWV